jgi:integrase
MKQLVRLRIRSSRDGRSFKYFIDYPDQKGQRKRKSLGHADRKKAERQRAQFERELQMGIIAPESMRLSDFMEDSLARTGDQVRESTKDECRGAMKQFIEAIGNIDYQRVNLSHGELFRQKQFDKGNRPATVAKKLRFLKGLFQLAVYRNQLDENPFKYIKMPRLPKKKVERYTVEECLRITKSARETLTQGNLRWDLLIITALCTAMRKSELLNCTWADIDFDEMTIEVSSKKSSDYTWDWLIKDADHRTLPLTKNIVQMLVDHQGQQPEGYPYVFVPQARYDFVQQLRKQGKWTLKDANRQVIGKFTPGFDQILRRANVRKRTFHCLRNTAITNWFSNGMTEHDVMTLAGHSSFATTHASYLAVADDLVDRARVSAEQGVGQDLARIWHAPLLSEEKA